MHVRWHPRSHQRPHLQSALPSRPLRPRQSGLDVYADLAWQQQILLCTPSSYCLCSARHGSLTHRSTAWRQIDCEHPDCPSWRGVWQSSDRHAELILQAHCLFSPALPAQLLGWVPSPARFNSRSDRQQPPPPPPLLLNPLNLSLSRHRTTDTDKITGVRVSPLLFSEAIFNAMRHDNDLWMAAAGKSECQTKWAALFKHIPSNLHQTDTHTHTQIIPQDEPSTPSPSRLQTQLWLLKLWWLINKFQ